ncbi:MAG: DUF3667 domain-containing protein [Mucilaginibacter sp.]
MKPATQNTCSNCREAATGTYCSNCGQELHVHRITLKHLLHEAAHELTHFDKGILYSLKQLVIRPGIMQREYLAGKRKQHQKPFALFFLCGTAAALALYWINKATVMLHSSGDAEEGHFYQHYFAILQMCLLPVYTLISRYIFNLVYNYAEYMVILAYNTSVLLLFVILANSLKLIFGPFETGYIEVVFVLLYNIVTYVNLFADRSKVVISLKTILSSVLCFAVSRVAMELFIKYVMGQ